MTSEEGARILGTTHVDNMYYLFHGKDMVPGRPYYEWTMLILTGLGGFTAASWFIMSAFADQFYNDMVSNLGIIWITFFSVTSVICLAMVVVWWMGYEPRIMKKKKAEKSAPKPKMSDKTSRRLMYCALFGLLVLITTAIQNGIFLTNYGASNWNFDYSTALYTIVNGTTTLNQPEAQLYVNGVDADGIGAIFLMWFFAEAFLATLFYENKQKVASDNEPVMGKEKKSGPVFIQLSHFKKALNSFTVTRTKIYCFITAVILLVFWALDVTATANANSALHDWYIIGNVAMSLRIFFGLWIVFYLFLWLIGEYHYTNSTYTEKARKAVAGAFIAWMIAYNGIAMWQWMAKDGVGRTSGPIATVIDFVPPEYREYNSVRVIETWMILASLFFVAEIWSVDIEAEHSLKHKAPIPT